MKTILRQNLPLDFTYYRTGSKVFYDYYRKHTKLLIHRMTFWYEFLRAWKIYKDFYSIIVEKIDQEPNSKILSSLDIYHGILFWSPLRRVEMPKWWFRLPKILIKWFVHASHTSFSILDRPDYWEKWSPSARAHRRKVLSARENGKIRIIKLNEWKEYLDTYIQTIVPDPYKEYLIHWCQEMIIPETHKNLRIYLAFIENRALAWAVFIDEWVTSEYFTSFYNEEWRKYQLGIALMDQWFMDSYQQGIKYCDLDHMNDGFPSNGTKGYTKFKESIADFDVFFRDMWIKIF